jgi:hypothetical protein
MIIKVRLDNQIIGTKIVHTSSVPLMHPSNSGLFVTWAYFDHTTFPVCVTKPRSDTFTSRTVPISANKYLS